MSRNGGKRGTSEAQLLAAAVRAVQSALPASWSVTEDLELVIGSKSARRRLDALLTIAAPDGRSAALVVEAKAAITPRDVASVAAQLNAYRDNAEREGRVIGGAMVVAPFVSPTTRTQLEQHGLGWFDATGNLRLKLDEPAVFLDRAGADRGGFRDPDDRLLKTLRGPAAAKVVLELCETSLPVGVRELAERAQVGVGTSARVLELLDRETAVDRGDGGVVTAVRKRALVARWSQDYKVTTSNEVIATLDPRGLDHALKALRSVDARAVVTGSAAARAYLPRDTTSVSPLVSLSLYAENPMGLIGRLGLRTVERGANVLVMRPYDEVVLARARTVDGIEYAAPGQVAADLLTGPGRSGEEAEQLLTALGSTEQGWEE